MQSFVLNVLHLGPTVAVSTRLLTLFFDDHRAVADYITMPRLSVNHHTVIASSQNIGIFAQEATTKACGVANILTRASAPLSHEPLLLTKPQSS